MEGWIKLHRALLDNPIVCKDAHHLAIWCYLLLKATHKEYDVLFNKKRIKLKAGQLITGRNKISTDLQINPSKVQRILTFFKIEQQIEQLSTNLNRLITIVNWCEYQQSEQPNEQQANSKRTASEQQVNTNKNVKNANNIKKKIYSANFEEFWEMYILKKGRKTAERHFRASIKTEKDYSDLMKAYENYKQNLADNAWKKPQNGDTWLNNWRDWLIIDEDIRQNTGEPASRMTAKEEKHLERNKNKAKDKELQDNRKQELAANVIIDNKIKSLPADEREELFKIANSKVDPRFTTKLMVTIALRTAYQQIYSSIADNVVSIAT